MCNAIQLSRNSRSNHFIIYFVKFWKIVLAKYILLMFGFASYTFLLFLYRFLQNVNSHTVYTINMQITFAMGL